MNKPVNDVVLARIKLLGNILRRSDDPEEWTRICGRLREILNEYQGAVLNSKELQEAIDGNQKKIAVGTGSFANMEAARRAAESRAEREARYEREATEWNAKYAADPEGMTWKYGDNPHEPLAEEPDCICSDTGIDLNGAADRDW